MIYITYYLDNNFNRRIFVTKSYDKLLESTIKRTKDFWSDYNTIDEIIDMLNEDMTIDQTEEVMKTPRSLMSNLALTDCTEGPDGYLNYLEIDEQTVTTVKYHDVYRYGVPNFNEKVETFDRSEKEVHILFYQINFNTRRGRHMDIRDEMIVKSTASELFEYVDEKCRRVNEEEKYYQHYTTTPFTSDLADNLKLYNEASQEKNGRYGYFNYYFIIGENNYKIKILDRTRKILDSSFELLY